MANNQFDTMHFTEEGQLNGDGRQSSEEGGTCSLEGRRGSSTRNGNWRNPNARKGRKEGEEAEIDEKDLRNVWEWNAEVPEAVEACVHDLITETARRQPEAAAVCAWDGNWTYGELDEISTRLAHRLMSLGVGPEVVVPLCFEKSRWTPVAMVAVMKAGGASVALDTTQPTERLRTIVQQVQPVLMLSSSANRALAERLTHRPTAMVVLDEAYLAQLGGCKWKRLPVVLPWTTVYVVFTSGSTGTPKGVIITHSNMSSAIKHQRHILGFDAKSRVYHFASYMFDVVWCDTLQGLSAGSCLCIPSDQERESDFIGGVARFSANIAILTPSTTRGLDQRPLQGLRNLHFIGEPLYRDCIKDIAQELTVSNLYGPAECTAVSTVQIVEKEDSGRISIGKGVGANTWVVRPSDHNYLAAVGSVGELLLEGPLVGAGYLGDAEKTAAAFIEDPLWLLRGAPDRPGRRGRLYKTGDLVRYNPDGSLNFIGRKDAQVKINGQRIELGDVEHHMRLNVADGAKIQVVAEAVTPRESDRTVLIAFLHIIDVTATGKDALLAEMKRITAGLDERLAAHLPVYMIPTAYIAINEIPMTATGKTDRRRLRAMGEAMTLEQLAAANPSRVKRRAPTTDKEKLLQRLWARVLGIDADSIGLDDSFLRIGGDSIGAMRLVAAAREEGVSLTVAEVFRQPRLVNLASAACPIGRGDAEDLIAPLSLLDEERRTQATYEAVASLCGIDASQVEDVFPCTPMQEGLLAMTARRAGDYVSRQTFLLRPDVVPERFEQAMRITSAAMSILRTRIVDLPGQGLVQVVTSTEAALQEGSQSETKLGARLATYRIECDAQAGKGGGEAKSRWLFIWTLHHAVYDGWSIPILYQALSDAYHNMEVTLPTPFQYFVKYVGSVQRDHVVAFWKSQLAGSEAVVFPVLPTISHQPQADKAIEHVISDMRWRADDVTPSTIIRAAWAIVSAQYTNSTEAVFGAIVSGRQATVAGIERMTGPTIATVPIVVKIDRGATVGDLLRQVQDQATEMVAYEQTGLQAIRRMSGEIARSSEFQTLLVVQPAEDMAGQDKAAELFELKTGEGGIEGADAFTNYALSVIFTLARDGAQVRLCYDSSVMVEGRVFRLALQLRHVLAQLCNSASTAPIASVLDAVSDADMEDIWRWNATVPETVERCVHEMIGETMRRQPNAPAICAWDGDFTYRELDELSVRLARHLVGLGVKRGDIVPLCFEKSKWTTVAIMGVMRAGAASVLLDATLPEERLRTIVRQTNAATLVSCCLCETISSQLGECVVLVDSITTQWLDESATALPVCLPVDTLYVVFTSGSTGLPKGAMISHANFATAFHHQQSRLAITGRSRVYDFVSYAFDVSWSSVLHTLYAGGCLCVPSESDRMGRIEASIEAFTANYAHLTPSIARMVDSAETKQLETINLIGEPVTKLDVQQWEDSADLIITYGPAECTVTSTIDSCPQSRAGSADGSAAPIGKGAGMNCWVMDRENHNVLMPLGCVGELLLEGPLVGQGYLNEPEKTAAAFIEDPAWLARGGPGVPGRRGRLYKTGDLVYCNPDGTLHFVGRKDAQVKINGQRVELGEIEHHVQRCLAVEDKAAADADRGRPSVVVEAVMPAGGKKELLAAFVAVGEEAASDGGNATAVIQGLCDGIEDRLAVSLPAYMIPTAYIAVDEIPMTATGKTDRRRLRTMGEAMTLEQLAAMNPSRAERRAPTTETEKHLQGLWARVLGIDADSIGLDDSFLRIGGDSIGAMRLVAAAREEGLSLTVAEVFRQPTLEDLASKIPHSDHTSIHSYMPLSMISASFSRDDLLSAAQSAVQKLHGSADAYIEDVFPVTEFQEFCLKQPTSRCYHFYADIPFAFDTQFLVELFTSVFQSIDCLRSVFLRYKSLYFQAVLQGLLAPITVVNAEVENINEACDEAALKSHHTVTGLGGFFTHFFIIRGNELTRLVLRVSHAQYDGVSLQLLASKLDEAFHHGTNQFQPQLAFSSYLYQAILAKDEALRYWRDMLLHSRPTKLAAVSSSTLEQRCTSRRAKSSRRIPAPCCPVGVTPASFFTTACAYAISQISASDDVLFGLLVTGRSALHPSLHDVFGPCINIIPVRYQDSQRNDFAESCHQIQAQCAESRSHEMAQFRDVTQMHSSSEALNFGAVIQFQDINESSWITTRGSSLSFKPMKLATVQDDCFPEETLFVSAEPFEGYWNVCVSGDGRRYDDLFVQLALKSIIDIIHQAMVRSDA